MEDKLFTLTGFAKYARISRDALCHYDNIGLLRPVFRDESNGYRYYSGGQLAVVNVIRTLRELGMSLTEIKGLLDNRSPQRMSDILMAQIDKVEKRIDEWVGARKLLSTLQRVIYPVLGVDVDKITVEYLHAQAIILGQPNEYKNKKSTYDALCDFYRRMNDKRPCVNLNYPVWGLFSGERIKNGDWFFPDRYYFYNPCGCDERPAGSYAIGYSKGAYGKCSGLYRRMLDYMNENGLEICGDCYEEYPLNELCVKENEDYLARVLIRVRERNKE